MPPVPGPLVIRLAVFGLLVAGGFVALRTPVVQEQLATDNLTQTLETIRNHPAAAPGFVVGTALLASAGLPATLPMIAGGAVFGTLAGGLLSFAGMIGCALICFGLGHSLARDFVVHVLGDQLTRVERLLEKLGFWNLFRLRFVPVPYALMNYGMCLAGVRLGPYLLSSAAALLPINLIYAYFASSLLAATGDERAGVILDLALAMVFLFVLSFVVPRLSVWLQRRWTGDAPEPLPPRERRS